MLNTILFKLAKADSDRPNMIIVKFAAWLYKHGIK